MAAPLAAQPDQGLLAPLLGLLIDLLQHHLLAHQLEPQFTVGGQAGLLPNGLGNGDLALTCDPHVIFLLQVRI
jgi:hypothetical protein